MRIIYVDTSCGRLYEHTTACQLVDVTRSVLEAFDRTSAGNEKEMDEIGDFPFPSSGALGRWSRRTHQTYEFRNVLKHRHGIEV